jgi:hypothetical protein
VTDNARRNTSDPRENRVKALIGKPPLRWSDEAAVGAEETARSRGAGGWYSISAQTS